jgi:hypothetical protein
MSYVIYEKSSTMIMGKMDKNGVVRPDYRKEYRSLAAAKAAITKWTNYHRRTSVDDMQNSPQFRYAIAARAFFHQNIERKVAKRNLSTGTVYEEAINTPAHMSPACETYWSM